MPTKSTTASPAKAVDALALLMADHKAVKALFKEYEKLVKSDAIDEQKEALVDNVCVELALHARVEEEIFYSAVRAATDDDDMLDEAEVEHATLKDLIAQLQEMLPYEKLYDAKVKVLSEYVEHHVREEEDEMFPKVRAFDLDLPALGRQMQARKETLKVEFGLADADAPPPARAKGANGSKRPTKSPIG